MGKVLSIRDLTVRFYTYEGIVHALENVNIDIDEQETFGLVGETGCGKTLTALSILRLIPPPGRIESGNILFRLDNNGLTDLLTLTEDDMQDIRGRTISMVFQEPSAALNPVFTIGDQIAEVILLHQKPKLAEKALKTIEELKLTRQGIRAQLANPIWSIEQFLFGRLQNDPNSVWPRIVRRIPIARRLLWRLRDEADRMAIASLKEVEIPDADRVVQQYPHQLSGGMKQRAMIAAALACSPKFLIADEPTTSLDVTIQAQIMELIRRLKAEWQSSILYITHDLAVAAELCDRVGVMYAGTLCEVASVDDIFSNPLHPYTRALMTAVPRPGKKPEGISGFIADPLNPPPGCRFHPRCRNSTEVCTKEIPEMQELAPGHFVACHNYLGEEGGSPT
jgi:peptide/nickel transport system ATP-binding protein